MTNELVRVERFTRVHEILEDAARHQFGPSVNISVWLAEHSPHGTSYQGFDSTRGMWVQVNLDFDPTK